jgi:probable HAF family extracellular repeat protein
MVGLGFVPGGTKSQASGVNADGSVVVGNALDNNQNQAAFRWTAATGMVGLSTLSNPRFGIFSSASGVNADGSVIVGNSPNA